MDVVGVENPAESVGMKMGPPWRGRGVSCVRDSFSSLGRASSLGGGVYGPSSGGEPEMRPGATQASGP
jgi:hypothetical protein